MPARFEDIPKGAPIMQEKIDTIEEFRASGKGGAFFYLMLGFIAGLIAGFLFSPKFVGCFNGSFNGSTVKKD